VAGEIERMQRDLDAVGIDDFLARRVEAVGAARGQMQVDASAASRSATPKPMPREPPVTSAVRPLRLSSMRFPRVK